MTVDEILKCVACWGLNYINKQEAIKAAKAELRKLIEGKKKKSISGLIVKDVGEYNHALDVVVKLFE